MHGFGYRKIKDQTEWPNKHHPIIFTITKVANSVKSFFNRPRSMAKWGKGKVFDVWQRKYGMTDDQGLREQHNMFVDMAQRGKLHECDDRAAQDESVARYGRGKVWTGSRKETMRKNGR